MDLRLSVPYSFQNVPILCIRILFIYVFYSYKIYNIRGYLVLDSVTETFINGIHIAHMHIICIS